MSYFGVCMCVICLLFLTLKKMPPRLQTQFYICCITIFLLLFCKFINRTIFYLPFGTYFLISLRGEKIKQKQTLYYVAVCLPACRCVILLPFFRETFVVFLISPLFSITILLFLAIFLCVSCFVSV